MVDYQKLQDLDVQLLGISANDSFSQKTFADSLKLPYPLLSDHPNLQVIRSYAGMQPYPGDPNRLVARRVVFLIDKQGIIQGKWLAENKEVLPSAPILQMAQKIAGKS